MSTSIATEPTPEHLQVETSDRGFKRLPSIPSEYGGALHVYESSAASGPHVWLVASAPADANRPDGPRVDAFMHLTAVNAQRLSEQLAFLVRNHSQNPQTDGGAPAPGGSEPVRNG